MDKIAFQEKLIWSKLACDKNILELTTYDGIAFWWNIDYLFYNFVRSNTEIRGANFNITKRNRLTTMILGRSIGLYFFFLLELSLFLFGGLISLIAKFTKKNLPDKGKPNILVISYDAAWVATPSYLLNVIRKSDHLKDSVMEALHDKINFRCTSSFRFRKASFRIAIERAFFWEHSYTLLNRYWSPKSWLKQKKANKFFRKQWNTIEKDPNFRKLCICDNIDLYEPILNEFKFYFFFLLPLCVSWCETFSSLIEKTNPSLAFISNESGHSEKSLIIAAKKANIPVLAMQHGIIDHTNRGYVYSSKDISSDGSIVSPYNPLSDKVAIFGTKFKNILVNTGNYPEKSVIVTGNPKFDKLFQMIKKFKDIRSLRRWLKIPVDKIIILWTTQSHGLSLEENRNNIEAVYTALAELGPNYALVIKLHPNEDQDAPLYRENTQIQPLILGKATEILQLIYTSNIVLTKHSMTGTETVALEKPVIILNLSGNPDIINCVEEGVGVGVYKKEDLKDTLLSVLQNDSNLAKNRPRYIESEFYKIDGKSSDRMANLMLSMISQSRGN